MKCAIILFTIIYIYVEIMWILCQITEYESVSKNAH